MDVRLVKAATNGDAEEMERLVNDETEAVLLGETERRSNCLHIASIYGHTDFCARVLQQLISSPDPSSVSSLLSATNSYGETPLLTAVKNGRESLACQLLLREYVRHGLHDAIQSRDDGHGSNVLHYAIRNGNEELALELIQAEPALSGNTNNNNESPMFVAALRGGGFKRVYTRLLDIEGSAYNGTNASNALHAAVKYNHEDFATQLVQTRADVARQLSRQQDGKGDTPMHLIAHFNRVNILENKIFWLILDKDSRAETDIYNLHEEIKNKVIAASREAVKSLTETYTGNTSLVAILIATITFAAAFTLPGGYSSSAESEGLPIMAKKVAFQAFLIFDTLGMCSSLAVAFICVIARWMDFEFLLHYRSLTKKLMWFAYMTTTLEFATGLYTVLSPRVHWLAVAICVLSVSLPILITLISEWPILFLRFRYCGKPFNANFIEMV
ncbi:hypothetical protein U9M48_000848 [Paspalum notatum var. saurae]|uniref:PGG domain-containing protein n=1 Tax=Paspalum notatum var. saurae TaxID=547442 RepID=A0AAQ3PHD0_PASNO